MNGPVELKKRLDLANCERSQARTYSIDLSVPETSCQLPAVHSIGFLCPFLVFRWYIGWIDYQE